MITPGELTQQAARDGVEAQTVERDYVMCHIVTSIGLTPECRGLQFKGGTSIRLCHEPTYRYSADIDLNVLVGDPETASAAVSEALDDCRKRIALPYLELSREPRVIRYTGPLGASPRKIKLDLTTDELVSGSPRRAVILTRYSDQPAEATVCVYDRGETLAEKIRCVMQRLQGRDLYDIWWLTQNSPPDLAAVADLFQRKARHSGLDPARFRERFELRAAQYQEIWSDELGGYLGEVPEFDRVLREVRRHLRRASLL